MRFVSKSQFPSISWRSYFRTLGVSIAICTMGRIISPHVEETLEKGLQRGKIFKTGDSRKGM